MSYVRWTSDYPHWMIWVHTIDVGHLGAVASHFTMTFSVPGNHQPMVVRCHDLLANLMEEMLICP